MDHLAQFLFKDTVILTVIMFVVFSALSPGLLTKRRILWFWSIALIANAAWWLVGSENSVVASVARPVAGIWAIMALVTALIGAPLVLVKGILLLVRWIYAKMRGTEWMVEKLWTKDAVAF